MYLESIIIFYYLKNNNRGFGVKTIDIRALEGFEFLE